MKALPRAARQYLYTLWAVAAGALILVGSRIDFQAIRLEIFIPALILFVTIDLLEFTLPGLTRSHKINMSDAVFILCIAMTGLPGTFIVVLGAIISEALRRRRWFAVLFNASSYTLLYIAMFGTYWLLHQPQQQAFHGLNGVAVFAGVVTVGHVTSTVLFSMIISLTTNQSFGKVVRASQLTSVWFRLISQALGAMLAIIAYYDSASLLIGLIPFVLLYYINSIVRTLSENNDVLTIRVAERTSELRKANAALGQRGDELQRINTQLIQAEKAAQDAAQQTVEFLQRIVHDYTTPIRGAQDIVSRLVIDDVQAGDLLHRQLDHISNLTDQLRQYLRGQAHVLAMAPTDMLDLCSVALQAMRTQAQSAQVALRLRPHSVQTVVLGDPVALRRVIDNLLSNAIAYAPPQSAVSLELVVVAASSQHTPMLRIAVTDQGPGISLADQARIFEPLVQLRPGSNNSGVGLGLGLAIVRDLVHSHRGECGVISTPGQGSSFWIELPLADARLQAAGVAA